MSKDTYWTDRRLARVRHITAAQAERLRMSRGLTPTTIRRLPQDRLDRQLRRLETPDLPLDRARFRARLSRLDDGSLPRAPITNALRTREWLLAEGAERRSTASAPDPAGAGVSTATPAAQPAGPVVAAAAHGWTWLGPSGIGGRTRSLLLDPDAPATMWLGSCGGGIWHSVDGGQNWTEVDAHLSSLVVASMVMHPTDHQLLFAGTGEEFTGLRGDGIFRSTDGGVTWEQLPDTDDSAHPDQPERFQWVSRLAFSADGGTLLAATASGIWRSTDLGKHWEPASFTGTAADGGTPGIADVDCAPNDPSRAIAGARHRGRAYHSTNGGATWQAASPAFSQHECRVDVTYALADPSIVYAAVAIRNGDDWMTQIWRSADGGQNYQILPNVPGMGLSWYNNVIWAGHPTNPNLIVVGGVNLFMSVDARAGGYEQIGHTDNDLHPDQHVIVAHPGFGQGGAGNGTLFVGNDAGIHTTENVFAAFEEMENGLTAIQKIKWRRLARGLGITQLYGGAVSTNGTLAFGSQDNGVWVLPPDGGAADWVYMAGGDGGRCAADAVDGTVLYSENLYLSPMRITAARSEQGDFQAEQHPVGQINDTGAFIAPLAADPQHPNTLYTGSRRLWRTRNADAATPNWVAITDAAEWVVTTNPADNYLNEISVISIQSNNANVIWLGYGNGTIVKTTSGQQDSFVLESVQAAEMPGRTVTAIAIDPSDPNRVYAGFGGDGPNPLWVTTDGGGGWTPIASWQNLSIHSFTVHPTRPNTLFAGTAIGLWQSDNGGVTWRDAGPVLCGIEHLVWAGTTLYCATYGRGMFRRDMA